MADTLGQADLRGLNVDKLVKGFADEAFIFKNFLTVTSTSAREIRWFSKAGGVLDSTDTTGITNSQIAGVAFGALPPVIEESVSRKTSYVKHYFVESPWFTYADVKDTDPDMLAQNIRQLTRSVQNQIDYRIFDVLSGTCLLSGSAAGTTGWSSSTANPVRDLLSGSTQIEKNSYNTSNLVVLMHPQQKQELLDYIITTAGSSIPAFSSERVKDGVLMSIVGQRVVVSNNATESLVLQIVPQQAATWKTFTPMTAVTKEEPGIGVKVRVWEDGEVLFTDPNAVHLIKEA